MEGFQILAPTCTPAVVLKGVCNGCGLCCTSREDGRLLRCEHLMQDKAFGTPEATWCRTYRTRVDGMPIRMLDWATGAEIRMATCAKDSDPETFTIIERGLGKGCSLTAQEA